MYQGSWTECILIDLLFHNRLKLICIDFRMHADDDKLLVLLPQLATNSASNLLQYKQSQKLLQLATIGSRKLVQYKNTQRLLVAVGGPVRHGPGQCGGGGGGAGGWVPWDVVLAVHQ